MRALRSLLGLVAWSALIAGPACNCGLEVLETPHPRMVVQPNEIVVEAAPVAQDTKVVIQIHDPSIIDLKLVHAELDASPPPAFTLKDGGLDEVLAGQTAEITLVIRPLTATELHTKIIITAEDNAIPNRVEVPVTVHSIDAGLPDICDYPGEGQPTPGAVSFDKVGQNDVARLSVPVKNCGVRDLILDSVSFCATPAEGETADANGCGADASISAAAIPAGTSVGSAESISIDMAFLPQDLLPHSGQLIIHSNDPDEEPVRIDVDGQGQACPTACIELVDGATGIQPFDTVRIDGRCSTPASAQTSIEAYTWTLDQRPVGSTTVLSSESTDRVELPVDLAGGYCVRLDVVDTDGVRSCAPAEQCFNVVPNEDLHVQLVWDHPTADLDLHMVQTGGTPFTHEQDCYFSNRHPLPADCSPSASTCAWVDNTDQNPSLDHDDNNGYGPENTNVIHPAAGSRWTLLVHYWNKQTDGDPRTTATVRVFVYGQQVLELTRTFEDDQQLWQAADIVWPQNQGDPADITQIGVVEPFPRPF